MTTQLLATGMVMEKMTLGYSGRVLRVLALSQSPSRYLMAGRSAGNRALLIRFRGVRRVELPLCWFPDSCIERKHKWSPWEIFNGYFQHFQGPPSSDSPLLVSKRTCEFESWGTLPQRSTLQKGEGYIVWVYLIRVMLIQISLLPRYIMQIHWGSSTARRAGDFFVP